MWRYRMRDIYTSLKHADRATPSVEDLTVFLYEGLILLRAWVAIKVTDKDYNLKSALKTDASASIHIWNSHNSQQSKREKESSTVS